VLAADPEADISAVVGQERPDVILLDVHLGQQNGMDILKALRKNKATHGVIVIMSSGMSLKEDCLHAGANAFLLKPYMPDELIATMKRVLAAK
jgi:DNA-binding response OmpR family regulator